MGQPRFNTNQRRNRLFIIRRNHCASALAAQSQSHTATLNALNATANGGTVTAGAHNIAA